MSSETTERSANEERFARVFLHRGFIAAYARRRGARDPEAIAAEAMTIAWRRLADVPCDDPRPWLIGTARNLLLADHRRRTRVAEPAGRIETSAVDLIAFRTELDAELKGALLALPEKDREALLLIAWEDLSPSTAAASLGITAAAFRVRLYRARRRLINALGDRPVLAPVDRSPASLEQS
jgi:RNA polymerase sigma-70 factor (ECF subfamily)